MDYETGKRIEEMQEVLGSNNVQNVLILKILEKLDPKCYKEAAAELEKEMEKIKK